MTFLLEKAFPFHIPSGMLLLMLLSIISCSRSHAVGETSSTSTMEPEVVRRCYKCEGNCTGRPGQVEECHPDTDTFKFACYKIVVDGKTFQRGCTRDFSEGEECMEEKGRKYCFCRKDECNGGGNSRDSTSVTIFLLGISSLIQFSIQAEF